MKLLVLCRHGKSSWRDPHLSDRDRPLNKRGKRDALLMGQRLAARDLAIDLVVTSPARRARTTARRLARQLDYSKKRIQQYPSLYEAGPATILAVVHQLDDRCQAALLVGHNPEFTTWINQYPGLDLDNLPTSGMVGARFDCSSWGELRLEQAEVLFIDTPKRPSPGVGS